MQKSLNCHRLNIVVLFFSFFFFFHVQLLENTWFMWQRTPEFSYMRFPFGLKSQRVIKQGKHTASQISAYTSFRVEFQCHVHSTKSRKCKETETEEFWNNYLLQISQNEIKGMGNVSIIRKSFPIYECILVSGNYFLKVNFLTRLSGFSCSPF